MSELKQYARGGQCAVRPYLCGPLNLPEFLTDVFGAVQIERHDFDATRSHVQMTIGDSIVVIEAGEFPAGASPWTSRIYVYVDDADAVFAKAISLGATVHAPIEDKPYQERQGGFIDAGGNVWWVSTFRG